MAELHFTWWGEEPPHAGQWPVWDRKHDIWDRGLTAFLACGPRWGKDRLSVWLNLWGLCRLYAERMGGNQIPPVLSWVVAPSSEDYTQVFREYETHTRGFGKYRKVDRGAGAERIILFPEFEGTNLRSDRGIWIEFKSGWHPERLVGAGIDSAHITEGAKLPTESYELLRTRLASPGRAGVQIINGTPTTAPAGWYVQLFRRGLTGEDRQLVFCNEPTWKNPTLTFRNLRELVRQRRTTSDRVWRANQGAELVPEGSGLFPGLRDACTAAPQPGVPGQRYVKFYDPAGRGADYNVLVAFDRGGVEVAIRRWLRDSVDRTDGRIREFCKEYPGELHIDETGQTPSSLVDRLKRDAVPGGEIVKGVTLTNALKAAWVDHAASEIEHGRLTLLDPHTCPEAEIQFGEMTDFQETRLPSGNVRYSAPEGSHDDCVITVIGAAYQLKRLGHPDPDALMRARGII